MYDVCSEYHSPAESTPLELPNLLQTLKSPASVNSQVRHFIQPTLVSGAFPCNFAELITTKSLTVVCSSVY